MYVFKMSENWFSFNSDTYQEKFATALNLGNWEPKRIVNYPTAFKFPAMVRVLNKLSSGVK